ncbi:isopentenyl-diphosphate Delta-isomerase [Nonomuraea sp. NPDC049129]|uniref:isopentenyl-diphosphate Delta-isomerase n=1 Tax=Nonomuraea sp. NPDC049129 TaxID=3155272 RepID=UPI0033E823AF
MIIEPQTDTGMSGSTIYVDLVDTHGHSIGTMEKLAAHRDPGIRHRAFSIFLVGDDGRLLMQRRASTKYHSPGVWTNTCCGHPEPGADPLEAANRRTFEEFGLHTRDLELAGIVEYRHKDPFTGLIEHEYNHTYVGQVEGLPSPNPQEIEAWVYLTPSEVRDLRNADSLSVWFDSVYEVARPALARIADAKW